MKKLHTSKKIIFSLGAFIFGIFILELGLRAFISIGEAHSWSKEKRYQCSVYKNSFWAKKYFDCFNKIGKDYYPFYEWRKKELKSQFINISNEGIRKTYNPVYKDNLVKVFVFGGSTIWGTGSRDEYTIPSLLSKDLNRQQDLYFVNNFGESGYVLNQELVFLTIQLKKGKIPNYVIFYDGVNDVLSAFLNGKTGFIYHYDRWKMKLNMEPKIFNEMSREAILNNIKLYYYVDLFIKKYIKNEDVVPKYADADLRKLACQVIEEYKENITFIDKLSKAYGFQYMFIWQPVLFTSSSITDEERRILFVQDENLKTLFAYTYEMADKLNIPHFYNLSHIFDNKKETFFIDDCHISEKANLIVANKIYELIKNEFPK